MDFWLCVQQNITDSNNFLTTFVLVLQTLNKSLSVVENSYLGKQFAISQ